MPVIPTTHYNSVGVDRTLMSCDLPALPGLVYFVAGWRGNELVLCCVIRKVFFLLTWPLNHSQVLGYTVQYFWCSVQEWLGG